MFQVSPTDEVTDARRWLHRLAIASIFLAIWVFLWFLMLYPLTPASYVGWAIEILSGIVVLIVGAGFSWMLRRIDAQTGSNTVLRLLGYLVAPLLGISIFVGAYLTQDYWAKEFSYFFR